MRHALAVDAENDSERNLLPQRDPNELADPDPSPPLDRQRVAEHALDSGRERALDRHLCHRGRYLLRDLGFVPRFAVHAISLHPSERTEQMCQRVMGAEDMQTASLTADQLVSECKQ
jgi:hypothetical protein